MWIFFSLLAAFFAGITSVFAKIGIKEVNSLLATSLRTTIILIFSLIVVFYIKSYNELLSLDLKTIIFLVLSGITTAFLWIFYFKALELSSICLVSPIDKTSVILTLILSYFFLDEKITIIKILSMILLLSGAILMTSKSNCKNVSNKKWLIYAILTAILTSLATILGKIGLNDIESNLASLIKTIIVFIIIWFITIVKKQNKNIKNISKKSWIFIILSGLTTGLSWLFYFKALQEGEASKVFPIEKLSIVVGILFSCILLKEQLNKKQIIGLFLIVISTVLLIIN